jgi:hypothetical protein
VSQTNEKQESREKNEPEPAEPPKNPRLQFVTPKLFYREAFQTRNPAPAMQKIGQLSQNLRSQKERLKCIQGMLPESQVIGKFVSAEAGSPHCEAIRWLWWGG